MVGILYFEDESFQSWSFGYADSYNEIQREEGQRIYSNVFRVIESLD